MLLLALLCLMCLNSCMAILPARMSARFGRVVGDKKENMRLSSALAAVDPSIAYTGLGLATAIGIYQKVVVGRFILSWFPQLYDTFPFLAPVYTVTEPYLNFFRRQIPAVGGFDISSIPALFILDLAGNAAASLGCEIPADIEQRLAKLEAAKAVAAGEQLPLV